MGGYNMGIGINSQQYHSSPHGMDWTILKIESQTVTGDPPWFEKPYETFIFVIFFCEWGLKTRPLGFSLSFTELSMESVQLVTNLGNSHVHGRFLAQCRNPFWICLLSHFHRTFLRVSKLIGPPKKIHKASFKGAAMAMFQPSYAGLSENSTPPRSAA